MNAKCRNGWRLSECVHLGFDRNGRGYPKKPGFLLEVPAALEELEDAEDLPRKANLPSAGFALKRQTQMSEEWEGLGNRKGGVSTWRRSSAAWP